MVMTNQQNIEPVFINYQISTNPTGVVGPGSNAPAAAVASYHQSLNGGSGNQIIGVSQGNSISSFPVANANSSLNSNSIPQQPPLCCLIDQGIKCSRVSGNASYSKRIEKQVAQRKLRLEVDHRSSHQYICEHHKQIIQSIRTSGKRKRKDGDGDLGLSIDDDLMNDFNGINNDSSNDMMSTNTTNNTGNMSQLSNSTNMPQNKIHGNSKYSTMTTTTGVDFHSLQVQTLRRYKRFYNLQTKPGSNNKTQLAEEVSKHFVSIPVQEKEVISKFMYIIKHGSNNQNNIENNSNNFSPNNNTNRSSINNDI